MSVKVAVRVRPYNAREKELNSELIVEMNGATTVLTNPEDQKTKQFTFDFSFWSHDGFENDENGYSKAIDDRYADQQQVYNLVGKEVLDNAWEGYHCCLFAYGQTGAGKSYSMVGYGANKGIVPMSMQQIFERISQNTNSAVSFEVCFSMQEIYNEKIQDLLIPCKDRPAEGLKVREHQKYGVYVDGLSKHPVDSYDAIEAKMEEGSKNRTIGTTLMNATSSRAHTIMTIEFKKIEIIDKKKTERFAVINLVDLAGSEKISKTGASGDRLKEGCAINKSLSCLGLVISKLADKSMGKKNVVVPYRDSALTRILQNALGGNSRTLMICAISPASDNYEETLSTLRYADQAKKIKNNAVINESEQDKMIRELREENEKLKSMLKGFNPGDQAGMDTGKQMVDEETLKKFQEMEEQLKANAFMMKQYEQSFEEKLKEAKEKSSMHITEVDKTQPYLMNLNEDPLLSGKVLHSVAKEKVLIGKKNAETTPDIVLGSIGIKAQHAEITNVEGNISIGPCDSECGEQLLVNGQKVFKPVQLFHNDRIIVGTNTIFIFKYPGKEEESPNAAKVKDGEIDWEFAQAELLDTMDKEQKEKLELISKEREKEVQEKIKMIEEKFQKEKTATDDSISKQKEEYEKKLVELEEKMKRDTEKQKLEIEKREAEKEWRDQMARYEADRLMKEKERERMQKEVQEEATLKRFKEQEKIHLEHKLAKHLSQITELNLIAKELKRDVVFSVKLVYNFVSGAELHLFGQDKTARTKIQVCVQNKETNNQYIWSMSKFTNRYFMIRDLLEQFYEGSKIPDKNTTEDPFWDPPEAHLIGQGFLCLESLGYQIDNSAELHLVSDHGTVGKLMVSVVPLDENGEPMNENDDIIDDPNDLISRRLDFAVIIEGGELPDNFCQDTYCQYALMNEDNTFEIFKTETIKGNVSKPEYNYKHHHIYQSVNEKVLNYLLNHNLKVQLYGFDIVEEKSVDTAGKNSSISLDKNSSTITGGETEDKLIDQPEQRGKGPAAAPQVLKIGADALEEEEEIGRRPVRRQTTEPMGSTSTNSNGKIERKTTYAVNSKVASLKAKAEELKMNNKAGKGTGTDKDKECNIF